MGLNNATSVTRPPGRLLAALLLTLALVLGTGSVATFAAPVASGKAVQRGIAPPDVSAQAVYAIDLDSGAVLYSKNADEQRPIASITKVVTALVTVKHVALDEPVTIVESDMVQDINYTQMGVRVGDTLTVSELLQGLLLPSGGDAANALARYVGGKLANSTDLSASMNAFMDEMNNYAKSLGLTESYFTTPAGDDDQGAFSSAHDLAIMGAELMKNADLAWIVSQPAVTIASQNGPSYELVNTNEMIEAGNQYYDPNVLGIKTGSTEGAGASVLLARKANGGESTVILVVLGSTLEYGDKSQILADGRWDDATAIFADMDSRFTWTQLDATGSVFPGLSEQLTVWGLELSDPPLVPLDKDATFQLVVMPPGSDTAGELVIYSGDAVLDTVAVVSTASGDTSVTSRGRG